MEELRFSFGENWKRYSKDLQQKQIDNAKRSMLSLVNKKDFDDSFIKFLYPSKFLANKGIFPLFPLY